MQVVNPVGDLPDALEASVHRQDGAGQLINELAATVEHVQLLDKPEIIDISDQGHGAYS
jgi:hypothetical protein